MATESFKMAKDTRLYIGKTSAAAVTADFQLIENENEIEWSRKSDPQEVITKSNGRIVTPGEVTHEIKFSTNEALTDTALALLNTAFNVSWPYEIREGATAIVKGRFLLGEENRKAGAVGVREGSYTLSNTGPITYTTV